MALDIGFRRTLLGTAGAIAAPVVVDETIAGQRGLVHQRMKRVGDEGAVDKEDGLASSAHFVFDFSAVDRSPLHARSAIVIVVRALSKNGDRDEGEQQRRGRGFH